MDSRLVQFPDGIESKEVKLLVFDAVMFEFVMEAPVKLGVIEEDFVPEIPLEGTLLVVEETDAGGHIVTWLVELVFA